jgi:hypothetical protein
MLHGRRDADQQLCKQAKGSFTARLQPENRSAKIDPDPLKEPLL